MCIYKESVIYYLYFGYFYNISEVDISAADISVVDISVADISVANISVADISVLDFQLKLYKSILDFSRMMTPLQQHFT